MARRNYRRVFSIVAAGSLSFSSAANAQSAVDPANIFKVTATTISWEGGSCEITLVLQNSYNETMRVFGRLMLVDSERNTLAETSFFFPSTLPAGKSRRVSPLHT